MAPVNGALQHWLVCVATALLVSVVTFTGVGGLIHHWFYVRKRAEAHAWKLQPNRWLSGAQTRQALVLGTVNIVLGAVVAGTFTSYVLRGGWCTLYTDLSRYGLWYLPVSAVLLFFCIDAGLYYSHRLLHHRALFRYVHRWHHRYTAPILFTTTAVHPFELLLFESFLILPAFLLPTHVGVYLFVVGYTYFIGMIDHSGVRIRWKLPLHGDNQFHDDHHVCFPLQLRPPHALFDRLHGTVRRAIGATTRRRSAGAARRATTRRPGARRPCRARRAREPGTPMPPTPIRPISPCPARSTDPLALRRARSRWSSAVSRSPSATSPLLAGWRWLGPCSGGSSSSSTASCGAHRLQLLQLRARPVHRAALPPAAPLYVPSSTSSSTYTGLKVVLRFRLALVPEALLAGLRHLLLDVPFDIDRRRRRVVGLVDRHDRDLAYAGSACRSPATTGTSSSARCSPRSAVCCDPASHLGHSRCTARSRRWSGRQSSSSAPWLSCPSTA